MDSALAVRLLDPLGKERDGAGSCDVVSRDRHLCVRRVGGGGRAARLGPSAQPGPGDRRLLRTVELGDVALECRSSRHSDARDNLRGAAGDGLADLGFLPRGRTDPRADAGVCLRRGGGALNTYVRFLQGRQTYWRRYAAAGFDPNDCGLILALSVPLALYLSLHARSWRRGGYYAAIAVVLAGVLLTASRAALVATFVALLFALWTWRAADIRQRAATVVLPLLLVLGLYGLAPAPSRERLATLPTELTTGTLHNRTKIWKAGVKVLRRHPILGIGVGAYPEAVKPQLGTPGVPGHEYVAHNSFLSVLVESGAVGFGLYGSMLCVLAAFIWTMPSSERALWAVMLLVWATGVSTLTWEQYKPSWLLVAWIMTEWSVSWRRSGSKA